MALKIILKYLNFDESYLLLLRVHWTQHCPFVQEILASLGNQAHQDLLSSQVSLKNNYINSKINYTQIGHL